MLPARRRVAVDMWKRCRSPFPRAPRGCNIIGVICDRNRWILVAALLAAPCGCGGARSAVPRDAMPAAALGPSEHDASPAGCTADLASLDATQ